MNIEGRHYRSIWLDGDGWSVWVINQTLLPHRFDTLRLTTLDQVASVISNMVIRGAPLIGAAAAYGMCLAMRADPSDAALYRAQKLLLKTRPTAVNLQWALSEMAAVLRSHATDARVDAAYARAAEICDEDVATCAAIGDNGLNLIKSVWHRAGASRPINILTHCNAGWLATVDWGTALAPIYKAHDGGIPVHVWVDETRPRNQGAALTAFELGNHGVPHTVIVDNTGGHLMQHGQVDLCITGADRITASGDVCNKIGTYLKALAAHDNNIPFYVALPYSTIDWQVDDGVNEIPIEERDASEVIWVGGRDETSKLSRVAITPEKSTAANFAFDVTPARLVTALITERGICPASRQGLAELYPERIP